MDHPTQWAGLVPLVTSVTVYLHTRILLQREHSLIYLNMKKQEKTPSQKQLDKLLADAQEAMNDMPAFTVSNDFKTFVLDYDKIKTVEDVVYVLKGLAPEFVWYTDQMPEQFKHLHEREFLIEKQDDKI